MLHQSGPGVEKGREADLSLPQGVSVSSVKEKLLEVVTSPSYTPSLLLDALSEHPRLAELLNSAPSDKGHTLRDHTHAVLTQYERYFASSSHPDSFSVHEMRITLALHDIGKYIPASTSEQHRYTMEVIEGVREILPLDEAKYKIMSALIDGDPIGKYMQAIEKSPSKAFKTELRERARRGELTLEDVEGYVASVAQETLDLPSALLHVEKAALDIVDASGRAEMPLNEYYSLLYKYFQADSSAHSSEGSFEEGRYSTPGLEFMYLLKDDASLGEALFEYDNQRGLKFARLQQEAIDLLESLLFDE